jgi:outer membrane protein insertion porin family
MMSAAISHSSGARALQRALALVLPAICVLLLADAPAAVAQTRDGENVDRSSVTSFDNRLVSSVAVDVPLERMREVALQAVAVRVGSPYNVDEVRNTLQNIYALGNVSDVQVRAIEDDDGLHVTFVVLPAARVREVLFEGDSPIGADPLRDVVRVRPGDRVSRDLVNSQAERVQLELSDHGYQAAQVEPEIVFGPHGEAADIVFHLVPGAPTRLSRLEVRGDLGVSQGEVRQQLKMREGGIFRNVDLEVGLTDLLAYLAENNFFHAEAFISAQGIDQTANTVDITIQVEAGPLVDLEIRGLDMSDEDQRELLPFWQDISVADWVLKQARQRVIESLQADGYWRPLVSYQRERDEEGRNVKVTFSVVPALKASVKDVELEGNENIPAEVLLAAIGSQPSGMLGRKKYSTGEWRRDQQAVLAIYRRQGFLAARIEEAPVRFDAELGGLRLTMRIDEREQVLVSDLRLEIQPGSPPAGIDPDAWASQLQLQAGSPFNERTLQEDEGMLRIQLANAGYARGQVAPALEPDVEAGTVGVSFTIYPGDRVRVGRILIAGNQVTSDEIIRRELAIVPGSPFTFEGVAESQSRLYRLGIFTRVEITPAQPDSLDTEQTIVVRVEEGPSTRLSWGVGYGSEEGPRGLLIVSRDNLYGKNRQGILAVRASFREQRGRLIFTEPYFLGRRLEASAVGFFESVAEPSFNVERYGGSFLVRKRHSEILSSLARYAFRRVTTFDFEGDPAELDPQDQSVIIGSVSYSLVRDSRPDPINPSSGTYSTAEVELAGEALGSQSDFLRLFGRFYWYRDMGHGVVFATAARAGWSIPFAGDTSIPLAERFFTGGQSTLRAFKFNEAGPTDDNGNPIGGEVLLVGNLELRFPVRGNLGGVIFLDVGNVFTDFSTVSSYEIREIAGIGVRYNTPVGPIRLDWGHFLDPRAGEDGSRFYISVGQTF